MFCLFPLSVKGGRQIRVQCAIDIKYDTFTDPNYVANSFTNTGIQYIMDPFYGSFCLTEKMSPKMQSTCHEYIQEMPWLSEEYGVSLMT